MGLITGNEIESQSQNHIYSEQKHTLEPVRFTIAHDLDPIADSVLGARFPILEAKRDYDTGLREAEKVHLEKKSNANAARAFATFLYLKGDYPKMIELGERVLGTEQGKNAFAW